ncbi:MULTISPECIES: AAA family ATPase [unclassified Pseudodesulfovibrio]|uniref:DNA repair protein RecN n=1 Tax=unclassified Pseudodesulfovibrio TaxID=2661612 RepID=UPI000FEBC9B9|nr:MULTISPECIES: AAA family ATPase [unclassified Pseudodesulfovibrio]MCJ2163572.1 AAA family ATPase [Pseudodesulfovibrio sp. S3-i]RWU06807.1 DNA repair protein RecN [Pseudodesulfovibrio sp. S3]
MLELLRIRNLALIEDVELEFSPGLNALTGETGAGKSFIMRAVDFLMGERMDKKLVRPGTDKATVEALFVLPEGETVIRRELSAETGRSRVYVNDVLSSQPTIRDMGSRLIIHTSQHGQQKLLSPAFQSEILDSFLPTPSFLTERNESLAVLNDVLERKRRLAEKFDDLQKQRDFLEYQKKEIEAVDPQPGEENELEERKKILKDREQAGECLQNALDILHGEVSLLDAMTLLTREMEIIARLFPGFEEDREAIEEHRMRLHDIDSRLRRGPDYFEEEETMSLDDIESRLFALAKLKRKLKRGLDEIVGMKTEIDDNLSFLDACALDMKHLNREESLAAAALKETLARLNRARKKAAGELSTRIVDELSDLGFSEHVKVHFEFDPRELYPGCDDMRGRLMWVPNPGQAAQPLDKIASGGELSRFLLALVTMRGDSEQDHDARPSLIFDEVDAGIGGLTLNSVGNKLRTLADRQQMLLITHWPQLARKADRHFLIVKEVIDNVTYTRCDRLEGDEIMAELSRMAGGGEQGAALAEKLCK